MHRRYGWIAAALALCGLTVDAVGQTTTTGNYQSTLKWGTSSTAATTVHAGDTPQAAYDTCIAAGRAKGQTAPASIVWSCEPAKWIGRTVVQSTCGAAPPPQEQTANCPPGQIGSWTQTRAYVSAAYPTCWREGSTWNPATPPSGTCQPAPVEPLPAPTTISAAQAGTDQTRIRVDWPVVVSAAAYDVERCIGATCTNFTRIQCVTTNAFIHGPLTPPVTARYRVRASRATGCALTAGNLGAYSAIATGSLNLATDGQRLTWIAPTANADGTALTNLAGYYVHWGTSSSAQPQTIQLANAGLLAWTIPRSGTGAFAAGTYYFRLTAYTASGVRSVESNMVSVTLP